MKLEGSATDVMERSSTEGDETSAHMPVELSRVSLGSGSSDRHAQEDVARCASQHIPTIRKPINSL